MRNSDGGREFNVARELSRIANELFDRLAEFHGYSLADLKVRCYIRAGRLFRHASQQNSRKSIRRDRFQVSSR